MRENNRKSIEKCRKKLSQFTTMNVIDGQAGLIIYTSLIFYSLTIDNILTIIILLILAGVAIATLTGENGILTKARKAAEATKIADYTERIYLIAAEEIAQRMETPKEELLIKSLKDKIKEQDWVKEVFMTDENGEEKTDPKEGTHLIVETKDGYELIVEVNNVELWAKVVEAGKTKKGKYEITYIEEGKKETVEVRRGFSISLKNSSQIKEGYQFTGWCESEQGEGIKYTAGSLYKPTKNTKLYAIYEEKTVTIQFNSNGGEGQIEDIKVKAGEETQLPNNETITKTGYNFKGWNTKQDGSGTSYLNNALLTTTEDITLYAMWEENITGTISITNQKLTEGTTVALSGTAANQIEKIELKVGNITLYSENNIGKTAYSKSNIPLSELNNLNQLVFFDNITVMLEITTEVGTKGSVKVNQVKNYTVSTKEQLTKLATVVNDGNTLEGETIIQLADIDVNPGKWTTNSDGTTSFQSGATQWAVIGTSEYDYDTNTSFNTKSFGGIFDGKSHKIEGIYINATNRDIVGLFGYNEGTIQNVVLKNSTIKGRYLIGGIAGGNQATIENCTNYARVTGIRHIGGICSWSNGVLREDINYGKIESVSMSNWKLEDANAGGIVGWSGTSILKCGNYGTINATFVSVTKNCKVGGIVGETQGTITISNCYNVGTINCSVTCEQYGTGGILGMASDGGNFTNVNQCYNKGSINGVGSGGIAGCGFYIKIQDCYNSGNIKGSEFTGGIIGWTGQRDNCNGSIINSYNVGSVSEGTLGRTGGVLGDYGDEPILTNCYHLNTSSTYAIGNRVGGGWGTLDNIWTGHIETKEEAGMKGLAGTLGSNWTNDTNNINNGYPILKWQIQK